MQDLFTGFADFINLFLEPFGLEGYSRLVAIIPFLVVLYILYLIVMRSITISFRKAGMPAEATSGIKMILRLLFFAFGLTTVLSAITVIPETTIITGGALFGTAVGLAFSKALSNMVSGFYVLGARPFRVGDYVRIGDIEGIVLEITLNYTRLLQPDFTRESVPNSKVIDSQLTNFRIRVDDLLAEKGTDIRKEQGQEGKLQTALAGLRILTKGTEVYRYSFELSIHKDYNFERVDAYFDEVCEKWTGEFLEKPEIIFWSESNFGLIYRVVYIVNDPMDILRKGSDFLHEISRFQSAIK
ncbi:MAG: mechanosensitive ion channel [Candidatus Thorarchaeota archaeon]|nr:mechanosensitive ion channel [Candidatus Thorarchaeota archaeon]